MYKKVLAFILMAIMVMTIGNSVQAKETGIEGLEVNEVSVNFKSSSPDSEIDGILNVIGDFNYKGQPFLLGVARTDVLYDYAFDYKDLDGDGFPEYNVENEKYRQGLEIQAGMSSNHFKGTPYTEWLQKYNLSSEVLVGLNTEEGLTFLFNSKWHIPNRSWNVSISSHSKTGMSLGVGYEF